MWIKSVAAASAVVLFGVTFGQARPDQPDAGRYFIPIWGRIIAYTGAPIQNQTVVLSGTGRDSIKTQTDREGRFRFPAVEGNKPNLLRVDTTDIDIGVIKRGQSYPHGDLMTHFELRDVNTERLIGKWDGEGKAPLWAQGLLGK